MSFSITTLDELLDGKVETKAPEKTGKVTEAWTIEQIVQFAAPTGWQDLFSGWVREAVLLNDLSRFLPKKEHLFRAFHLTPLDQVRVVIIGQDPYPTPGDADGLSFSYSGAGSIPRSLQNIRKELCDEFPEIKMSGRGDLSNWARQGVLMLNHCLTVEPRKPGSHKNVWNGFIKRVFKLIVEQRPHTIVVMWGRKAEEIREYLSAGTTCLTGPHPSPQSPVPFRGCGHFLKINTLLEELGSEPIDWSF